MEDSVHRHSNTNIQQPSHSPWPPRPSYHVIWGPSDHNEQKVSSRLTDKDSQPPVYQVGLGQRVYILPGASWATLGHLPPTPQHPRTPGHKAFRSQLMANELGGIRFAGPPYNPDQPEPTPSDNQGLWGSGVGIFPQRSHTYRGRRMPMGVASNWCHPQGHHARRPPTTVHSHHKEKPPGKATPYELPFLRVNDTNALPGDQRIQRIFGLFSETVFPQRRT